MFEVIWSNFQNEYIVRSVAVMSNIKPQFMGDYDQCVAWAKAHNFF